MSCMTCRRSKPFSGAATTPSRLKSVSYTHLCTVTLENFNLSHVPVYIMSEEQLGMYATYMATLGNRPDPVSYTHLE